MVLVVRRKIEVMSRSCGVVHVHQVDWNGLRFENSDLRDCFPLIFYRANILQYDKVAEQALKKVPKNDISEYFV